jgi:glycosyltransferase involved in cell wall biosynthesis
VRLLHTEASLGWGGQEIRILTEARGVARRGHDVLLAAAPGSRILAEAARFGVEATELPIGRKRLGGVGALRKLLRTRAFDVINTHSSTDAWLVALAARGAYAPVTVRTRHISAPIPGDPFTRWLYTRATSRVVTTGERLREQVMRETHADANRVVSIPTGIDLQRFAPGDRAAVRARLGLAIEDPLVGIVATLRSWKGHTFLFDALAASTHRNARLIVVGDGPQREALEARAKEGPLAGRVRFVGNQDDVAPWMQALDLFCLPSYANEGVPQSLMQAMACGLPVISTPVGSIDEIVADGDTGVMVAPRDAAALCGAIDRLLGDSVARRALGERAHAVAHERFGEDRMVDRMLAVFEGARHG